MAHWYRLLDGGGRRAFWSSFAGFCLDAMDVQLYAFMLPVLLTLWHLTHSQAGLIATVTLVSSAAGGWGAGMLADRIGRVRLLQGTILWLAVSTCLCGLTMNFHQLLAARFVQGIGFGGEWAAGAVFIGEIAAPESRARMLGMAQSAWPVGWGLAAVVSTIALSALPPAIGWRAAFLVGFLPAIIVFLFRLRLREPAIFLTTRRAPPRQGIFSAPLWRATARGSLLATGMHAGYWAIASWWPAFLQSQRGLSVVGSSFYLAPLVGGSFFGYVCGSWLGDKAGRRITLAGFALGATILLLACTTLPVSNLTLLLLSFPLGFFALGMFSVIGAVLTESYPTELRGSGLGFCYNFGRGLAGTTPFLVGAHAASIGIGHALGIFASAAYCVVFLAAILLPETRGQALRSLDGCTPS